MTLNKQGMGKYRWATERDLTTDTPEEIARICMEQECVNYSTERGSITFDYTDVDYELED